MNVTSVFINNCWKLVGQDAVDPAGLTELFATFEQERERLAKLEEKLRVALDETSSVYNELNAARKELKRYEDRESSHLRSLFSAFTAHLLFPDAPEAESIKSLLKRVEEARAYKVSWKAPDEAALDPVTEQRAEEAERAMKARRAGWADVERVREANARLALSEEAQLTLGKELEAAREEIAQLEARVSELTRGANRSELDQRNLQRIRAASDVLNDAIEEWRRVVGHRAR